MTKEDLQQLIKAEPFRPFEIHLANGRRIEVRHPDFVLLPQGKYRSVHIAQPDGWVNIVNMTLIVSMNLLETGDSSNGVSAPEGNENQ